MGRNHNRKFGNGSVYYVQDPALMCTSTGYGEQTISKNRRKRFIYYGPDADGRSTDLQSDRLGSIPTVSTICSVRQAVKSSPFHGEVTGSIPVQSTMK